MDNVTNAPCARISSCAMGVAFGTVSALFVLVIGVLAHFMQYGAAWVGMVSSVYLGFAATPLGILIGVAWAFGQGYVFGFVLVYVYNAVVKRCNCKSCHPAA